MVYLDPFTHITGFNFGGGNWLGVLVAATGDVTSLGFDVEVPTAGGVIDAMDGGFLNLDLKPFVVPHTITQADTQQILKGGSGDTLIGFAYPKGSDLIQGDGIVFLQMQGKTFPTGKFLLNVNVRGTHGSTFYVVQVGVFKASAKGAGGKTTPFAVGATVTNGDAFESSDQIPITPFKVASATTTPGVDGVYTFSVDPSAPDVTVVA